MRLRKTSTRLFAASLCLAVAVTCTGCGGSGGGSAPGNFAPSTPGNSSSVPSGSQDANRPGENTSSGDNSKKDEAPDVEPTAYEPVNQAKMAKPFSDDYGFCILIGTPSTETMLKFTGPYSYYKKGDTPTPSLQKVFLDSVPEDYLRDENGTVINYIWDSINHKFLHIKNAKDNAPLDASKWEYKNGYKYICTIFNGNRISPFSESIYSSGNLKNFDGWCKEENVDDFLASLDLQSFQSLAVLNGCPFQENLKATPNSDISGYYLYNGRVYFER